MRGKNTPLGFESWLSHFLVASVSIRENHDSYLSGLLGHKKYEHCSWHIMGILKMVGFPAHFKGNPFFLSLSRKDGPMFFTSSRHPI